MASKFDKFSIILFYRKYKRKVHSHVKNNVCGKTKCHFNIKKKEALK